MALVFASGIPTSLPPSGAAGGDLTGTYPNPTIAASAVTAVKLSSGASAAGLQPISDGAGVVAYTYYRLAFPEISGGVYVSTFDRRLALGTSLLTSGSVYAIACGLYKGEVVTSLSLIVTTGGAALTLSKVGLYDDSYNRLAVSADQGTAWQSVGTKTAALTAPFTITATRTYYLAMIAVGGTGPTVVRGATLADANRSVGGGDIMFAIQTGQADLPNPLSPAAEATGSPVAVWLGVA